MQPVKIIRSKPHFVQHTERTLSEAQLSADPDLVAAGWELRFIADGTRTPEVRELYERIGFEVRAEPLPGTDDPDECRSCQDMVRRHFHAIYTRRRSP
jgi:hypothetical protein